MGYLVEGLELLTRKVAYRKYDATWLVPWSNYTIASLIMNKQYTIVSLITYYPLTIVSLATNKPGLTIFYHVFRKNCIEYLE
jgi:hypothetical protein